MRDEIEGLAQIENAVITPGYPLRMARREGVEDAQMQAAHRTVMGLDPPLETGLETGLPPHPEETRFTEAPATTHSLKTANARGARRRGAVSPLPSLFI